MNFTPPLTPPAQWASALRDPGHAVGDAAALCDRIGTTPEDLLALSPHWNDLPADQYLLDGGRYRRRRHACYVVEAGRLQPVAHRAHWQPVEYNALHGGLQRWFEPIVPAVALAPAWSRLLLGLGHLCTEVSGAPRWHVEAHQFRIDTTDGIGRPTPEGAHRDGVDFVAVVLVHRLGVKGGETRVFEAAGPRGLRFTLTQPWSLLLLDDEKVIHESTPIQPLEAQGHRDTLVLTFRAAGFQGPAASQV